MVRSGPRGSLVRFSLPLPASELVEPWLDLVRRLVPRLGFAVVAGAGPDPKTAQAFLRTGLEEPDVLRYTGPSWGRLYVGETSELPIWALWNLDAAQRERLRRLGLRTAGEILARPAAERRSLIGVEDGKEAGEGGRGGIGRGKQSRSTSRLDRSGHLRAHERVERTTSDRTAVTDLPSLEILVRSMAEELADRWRSRSMGACHLVLTLRGEKGASTRERVFFSPLPPHRLTPILLSLLGTCEHPGPILEVAVEGEGERIEPLQRRLGPGARFLAGSAWTGAAPPPGSDGAMIQMMRMAERGDARMRREVRLAFWDPLRMSHACG